MRLLTPLVLFLAGVAHAEPGKADAKKAEPARPAGKPAAGPPIKVPPLPPQLDNTMFADAATAAWAPVTTLPRGAQGALIGTDPNNGGMAGWLKLPPGYRIPPAWESHNTTYTVITGTLTIGLGKDKHVLGPGGYAVLTMKDKHELSCGPAECLLIVQHLGPPDMHWVNPADAPKTR